MKPKDWRPIAFICRKNSGRSRRCTAPAIPVIIPTEPRVASEAATATPGKRGVILGRRETGPGGMLGRTKRSRAALGATESGARALLGGLSESKGGEINDSEGAGATG